MSALARAAASGRLLAANQAIPAAYYWNSFGCSGDKQSPARY